MLRPKSTMTPITLKQLATASAGGPGDAHYKVDGKDLIYARLIARVINITDDASQARLTLTDGTLPQEVELSWYYTQLDTNAYGARRAQLCVVY